MIFQIYQLNEFHKAHLYINNLCELTRPDFTNVQN